MQSLSPETPRTNEPNTREEYLSTGALILEMVKILLLAVVIIIPIRAFLFQPFFVQGSSMEPNFDEGEYLVISEFGYKHTDIPLTNVAVRPWRDLARQEPVVFRYPRNPEQFFIKRVIALPGESVEIKNGKVRIYTAVHPDGYELDESAYLDKSVKTGDFPKLKLSDTEYFLLGDNRAFSYDSRAFGPIDKTSIIGRVLLRAWPLNEISFY